MLMPMHFDSLVTVNMKLSSINHKIVNYAVCILVERQNYLENVAKLVDCFREAPYCYEIQMMNLVHNDVTVIQ